MIISDGKGHFGHLDSPFEQVKVKLKEGVYSPESSVVMQDAIHWVCVQTDELLSS